MDFEALIALIFFSDFELLEILITIKISDEINNITFI